MNDFPERERVRHTGPSAQITALLVGQARMETKVDSLLEKFIEVDALADQVTDHENRLIKMETYQGIILWVVNGGWAVLVTAALVLVKLGVI